MTARCRFGQRSLPCTCRQLLISWMGVIAIGVNADVTKEAEHPVVSMVPPRLEDVLQFTLIQRFPSWEGDNKIELSNPATNPDRGVANTLYLNLKNVGTEPIYRGQKMWEYPGAKILTSFVLGDTQACLTCKYPNKTNSRCPMTRYGGSEASAWNVGTGIMTDYTDGWVAYDQNHNNGPCAVFHETPSNVNREIIGAADGRKSNVTFMFTKIVSYTPVGQTQMVLHLTGFPFDETTYYKDTTIVLNITKYLRALN